MKRTTTKNTQIKQVFEVFVVVTISHTQKKLTKIFYYYFVPPVADIIVCNVFGSKVSVLLTSQISKWLTLSMCFQHWSRYCWVFRPSWRCCWSDKTHQYFKYNLYWTSPERAGVSGACIWHSHVFSLPSGPVSTSSAPHTLCAPCPQQRPLADLRSHSTHSVWSWMTDRMWTCRKKKFQQWRKW